MIKGAHILDVNFNMSLTRLDIELLHESWKKQRSLCKPKSAKSIHNDIAQGNGETNHCDPLWNHFFFTQHVCDYNTKKTSTTLRYNWTIWGQPSVFNPTKFGRRVLRVYVEHCWTLHFGRHLQQVMRVWKLPSIWAMGDFFPLRYLRFRDTIIHVLTNGSDHQLDAMWQWLELGNWSAWQLPTIGISTLSSARLIQNVSFVACVGWSKIQNQIQVQVGNKQKMKLFDAARRLDHIPRSWFRMFQNHVQWVFPWTATRDPQILVGKKSGPSSQNGRSEKAIQVRRLD